jgi:hypothetical protein
MSNKSKRSVSQNNQPKGPSVSASGAPRKVAATLEFNPDYTPVKKGLKKIGILAVSFVAVLIVLSFFIH